ESCGSIDTGAGDALCCGRRMGRPCNRTLTEEGGYFAQGLEGAEMLRPNQGGIRKSLLNGGENFHPLDGVDTEVGVEPHVEVEHFDRIAGLLADNRKESCGSIDTGAGDALCCGRRMGRPCNRTLAEEGGYFAQGLEGAEMLRPNQ